MRPDGWRVLVEFPLSGHPAGTRREVLAGASRQLWPPASDGFGGAIQELVLQLDRVRAASEAQAEATGENTAALVENTRVQGIRTESAAASVSRSVARIFASGLGLSPLLSGLVKLFKGEEDTKAPTLVKYLPPPSLHFDGLVSRGERGYWGEGREAVRARARESVWDSREPERTPVQVTVQVQAMDSRSFIDHSWEIARAVREAMLQSHALNDVVTEI